MTILLPLPSRLRPGKLARRRRRDAKRRAEQRLLREANKMIEYGPTWQAMRAKKVKCA